MTTARFSQVLAKSGVPHVHLTWTTPTRDKTLHAAVEHARLLTVHQNARGQKKDFGLVGLHPGRTVQYLVFPKSLRPFAGKRIVAIDYSAIAADALVPAPARLPRPKAKPHSLPRKFAAPKADIVDFESSPVRPAPAPRTPAKTKPARGAKSPPWRDAVRQAAADLKRGQTVAAYDRLQRLLATTSGDDA